MPALAAPIQEATPDDQIPPATQTLADQSHYHHLSPIGVPYLIL